VTNAPTVPFIPAANCTDEELLRRAREFRDLVSRRRTVRDFDPRPVPRGVIEACIVAAGTAPSGANQ
jgi:hypothetical protein